MRFSPLHPEFAQIPEELKRYPQWVCWLTDRKKCRTVNGKEKCPKVPRNPRTGQHAKPNDRATWGTFAEAQEGYRRFNFDGIGFVLTETDPFICIDVDDSWDGNLWTPEASRVLDLFATYAEVSASGTGLHLFLSSTELPEGRVQDKDYEVYWQKHFIALTGHLVDGRSSICDCTESFQEWHAEFSASGTIRRNTPSKTVSNPAQLSVKLPELLISSPSFRRLFEDGDTTLYKGDDSRADLAMLSMAVRAGIHDFDELDQLMRASRLMRDKWEREDYRERTIQKALESVDFERMWSNDSSLEGGSRDELLSKIGELEQAVEIRDRTAQVNHWQSRILRNRTLKNVAVTASCLLTKFFHFEERGLEPPYRLTITEIAEATGRHRNTVSRHVCRLVEAGLVTSYQEFNQRPVDRDTGELLPPQTVTYIAPVGTALEFAGAVAKVQLPRKRATQAKEQIVLVSSYKRLNTSEPNRIPVDGHGCGEVAA